MSQLEVKPHQIWETHGLMVLILAVKSEGVLTKVWSAVLCNTTGTNYYIPESSYGFTGKHSEWRLVIGP